MGRRHWPVVRAAVRTDMAQRANEGSARVTRAARAGLGRVVFRVRSVRESSCWRICMWCRRRRRKVRADRRTIMESMFRKKGHVFTEQ